MGNLDLIILTAVVVILYLGFAFTLYKSSKDPRSDKDQ
ncbi:hypothetical protein BH09BAC2_BH09BAC2_01460 [soil metagenome]